VRHVAVTRACTTEAVSGVPVGTHVAVPDEMTSGCFIDVTRTVPTLHVAVVHGPPDCGGKEHPETVHGGLTVSAAFPPSVTRGLGTVGCAWPP
jgi:hypothetical protein